MQKRVVSLAGSLLLLGCVFLLLVQRRDSRPVPGDSGMEHAITQVATIDSLLAGVYDGETTLEELARYGNFGIGTFDKLDGEMVLLDGVFHQVKADGRIYRPNPGTKTPFASVVPFEHGTIAATIDMPLDDDSLRRKIDAIVPGKNVPIAIRLRGRFSGIRTRSVPSQQKPYRSLAEVAKTQPEFDLGTLDGDVVGFRLPEYMKGINVPDYHLHFLSRDRTSGGHLLRLTMDSGTIELEPFHRFRMILPKTVAGFAEADLSRDRSRELEKVEK